MRCPYFALSRVVRRALQSDGGKTDRIEMIPPRDDQAHRDERADLNELSPNIEVDRLYLSLKAG